MLVFTARQPSHVQMPLAAIVSVVSAEILQILFHLTLFRIHLRQRAFNTYEHRKESPRSFNLVERHHSPCHQFAAERDVAIRLRHRENRRNTLNLPPLPQTSWPSLMKTKQILMKKFWNSIPSEDKKANHLFRCILASL